MKLYGAEWEDGTDRFILESEFIRKGGYLKIGNKTIGEGLVHHTKEAMRALWPHYQWHKWSNLLIESFVKYDEVGVMGPASSSKTYNAAAFGLLQFYVWRRGTSVLMSTTTRQGLQLRVWGAVKELHSKARMRRPWLPGKIIESQYTLINDEDDEHKDFRDGVIGVACRVGGEFVGLANYVGIKNDRVILIADEASLMPPTFLNSVANLRKNPTFKLIALGNPKERLDALGKVCEPSAKEGGWDGLPYEEKTRTWRTRARNGIAIQICGYDSPNYDYPKGLNPWRGIIRPEDIEDDKAYYGEQSLQFSMMNLGCMPKDGGARRIITLSLCDQNQAFEKPVWAQDDKLVRVSGLDAAYSGVGGDRCVLTDLVFGPDIHGKIVIAFDGPQKIVPVNPGSKQQPEEQIAEFCRKHCENRGIKPDAFAFDSTGRGSLMSAFARLWSPSVVPIEFGGRPQERIVGYNKGEQRTESDMHKKMVSALWFAARRTIESKQLRDAPRECVEEAALREYVISDHNMQPKEDVEPKDKTKERMGRSPDLFDSFVVALEIARRRGFNISAEKGFGLVKRTQPTFLRRWADRKETFNREHALTYA